MNATYSRIMADVPISTLLQKFLEKNHKEQEFKEHSAAHIFLQTLPENFSSMVKSAKCKQGILSVNVENASLRFELMAQRSSLMAQVNEKLGGEVIKEIRFI